VVCGGGGMVGIVRPAASSDVGGGVGVVGGPGVRDWFSSKLEHFSMILKRLVYSVQKCSTSSTIINTTSEVNTS
jgi:hypothetical protein